jgi:hypothetical protein
LRSPLSGSSFTVSGSRSGSSLRRQKHKAFLTDSVVESKMISLVKFRRVTIVPLETQMKRISAPKGGLAAGAALLLAGFTGFAQLPSEGSPPGVSVAMLKLFGNTTAFTARVEVRVLDKSGSERIRTPMNFAALDGKIRVEIDMAQMHGTDLLPATVAGLKQLGMDRVVSVVRPDRKAIYIIYPGAKGYVILPLSKEESEAATRNFKVEKTALGRETLDARPCVKNQVVVKNGANAVLAATTWNATDLKDFPIQIATKENGLTSIMRFQQVQFARLDAKQFEPPAGFTAYSDPQALMLGLSKKATRSAKK